jgi:acetylornithine deacetylase/succinyl-diaminopimelate desuccinylase-like protein
VRSFFTALGLEAVTAGVDRDDEEGATATLLAAVSDPVLRRSLAAMLRDTVTPTTIHSGKKVNVIPGAGEAELDIRTLPGTDQHAVVEEIRELLRDLAAVELVLPPLPPTEAPADAPIVALMREALLAADPEGIPAPMMITPGTDAKSLATLGVPTYGFAPLRLDPDVPFLSLFHAHDERVPVSALRFGLPVLHEVVSRYVGVERPG